MLQYICSRFHHLRCIVPYLCGCAGKWDEELNRRIICGLKKGVDWGIFKSGDPVVLVIGLEKGAGGTNCIQLVTVPREFNVVC